MKSSSTQLLARSEEKEVGTEALGEGVRQRVPSHEEIVATLEWFKQENYADFDRARVIFGELVDPEAYYLEAPSEMQLMQADMAFTEWALFDYPFEGEPLIAHLARIVPEVSEFARTQFFSRFWMVERHPRKGSCVLRDIWTCRDYPVQSEHIARKRQWKRGTLGVRIACADGIWQPTGQLFLHDNAQSEPEPPRKDATCTRVANPFDFIYNVQQVIGHRGMYRDSLRSTELF